MKTEAYIQSLESLSLKKKLGDSSLQGKGVRLIIAGGGTGGHIFPAIAIANAIKERQPDAEILFVGASGKMEMQKIPEAGYKIIGLYIAGYDRSDLLKNITLPFKLMKSFLQVFKILRTFKPNAVIGVGGYSSFPVLRMAQTRNIPTFIHESNSLPGRSNKILARRVNKIFVASEETNQFFPPKKIVVTGNPVRKIFSESNIIRKEAIEFFGLRPELKTVFVVGGSLGAKSINETIAVNITGFKKNNLQLIWQTGKSYSYKAAGVEEEHPGVWTNAFIDKIEYAYAAADVVVSRAGAMAIAELCIVGKPVIFVPYPLASEDHQMVNAMTLVKKNAALVVKDSEVKSKLMDTILQLINNETLSVELKTNISKLANIDADKRIAEEILNDINKIKTT
jgi:UDP-N-acetylglucosamine--N-acetylmuramyl-(pentapeptide) pyrophosphoryl-undecaprenol N-acetylglucosamine transferase